MLFLTAGLHLLDAHAPPRPLYTLGGVLKIEHRWIRPERLADASASAEALGHLIRLAAFLATDASAHGGGSLDVTNTSAVAEASARLLEFVSKLRPVLAVFRRATHAVIETDNLSLEGGGAMLGALNDALLMLLLQPPPPPPPPPHPLPLGHSAPEPPEGNESEDRPDYRSTAVCLELLPAICSAGSWGLQTGTYPRFIYSAVLP